MVSENKTHHKSLNEYTDNALKAHNEDRFRAFFIRCPGAVTDRVLGFYRE